MEIVKKQRNKRILIVLAVLLALVVMGRTQASIDKSRRLKSVKQAEAAKLLAEKKEAVKSPENKPDVKAPTETPKPAPTDPNGCEAKGMWYRADNNECLAKPTPKSAPAPRPAPKAAAKPAAPAPAKTAGSGNCSLVNNYNWPKATAYRVCMQESSGNPNAANWRDNHMSWAGCMGSFGLMGINCSHGQVYDGARNMAIAYQMWKAAGGSFYKDWPNTCRKVGC